MKNLFQKGPLDGGIAGDRYLVQRPAGHWHISFTPGLLQSSVHYHQPEAAHIQLTRAGIPNFYTKIPDNPRDKFLHVIGQINPWCDDNVYALLDNKIHVLLPYTSMDQTHLDHQRMKQAWHTIVKNTRPWYNPFAGNLEQRASAVSTMFPPESHIVAFNR